MSRHKEARWIAEQLGENQDDVYDVLAGNITSPYELYESVNNLSREYHAVYEKMTKK